MCICVKCQCVVHGNTQLLCMLAAKGVMSSGPQVVGVMFVAINLFAKSPVQQYVAISVLNILVSSDNGSTKFCVC